MQYGVTELFYSIKGEGVWTGTPMAFIRLSGCNLKCPFCDTNYSLSAYMDEFQIVSHIKRYPTKRVVITGGEPLTYDLRALVKVLRSSGYLIHLETNGTINTNIQFDWIAVSPKEGYIKAMLWKADEIKVLYKTSLFEELIRLIESSPYINKLCKLWIMPLGKSLKNRNSTIPKNIKNAVNFCKEHPKWNLCTQIHKFCKFP